MTGWEWTSQEIDQENRLINDLYVSIVLSHTFGHWECVCVLIEADGTHCVAVMNDIQ